MDVTTKGATVGNGVIGCWLIVTPFVFGVPSIGRWNNVVTGGAIVLISSYNYSRVTRLRPANPIMAVIAALLGFWLVISPFVLTIDGHLMWSNVASGTIITSFAAYNAYAASSASARPPLKTRDNQRWRH